MSCIQIDAKEINYLVRAILTFNASIPDKETGYRTGTELSNNDLTKIGQALLDKNIESCNNRYEENSKPEKYKYNPKQDYSFNPVQVIKSCNYYEYQTCEASDWEGSDAKKIIENIITAVIRNLPGYDKCDWGIPTV